jgi:hypothetical protein
MLIFGAIFAVSAIGGYFFREEKVYMPAHRNIQRRVHEESQKAMDEGRKPLTAPIRQTIRYCDEQVNKISKRVDVKVYFYKNGTRKEETRTFDVNITNDNIENSLSFIGQGNQNNEWRRGDITFVFEHMNWAEVTQRKITETLKSCYGNMDESKLKKMAGDFTNQLKTYGSFTMPNPNNPEEPIVFKRDEMV